MSKNIYVDSYSGNTIAALAEEGKLLEYHIEKRNSKVIAGSIFKGVVENVIDGMQAAFVNVGLDKNGYLYAVSDTWEKNLNFNDCLLWLFDRTGEREYPIILGYSLFYSRQG